MVSAYASSLQTWYSASYGQLSSPSGRRIHNFSSAFYSLKYRKLSVFCSKPVQERSIFPVEEVRLKRREATVQTLILGLGLSTFVTDSVSVAGTVSEENFRVYSDDANKYQISIPQDWLVGQEKDNRSRTITAFYPEEADNSNVSILITGVGPDFTRMESFGSVDAFAETLVSGLDRSWKRPPGVKAKLINSKSSKGFYYIEYTLQNPGESCRHIVSAIGMASNGWYNRLYTVTGQYLDEETEKYGNKIEKSVLSFRFI